MPVQTQCPSCERRYTLADNLLGKRIRCKACQTAFEVQPSEPEEPRPAPARSKNAVSAGPPPVRKRQVVEEEDRADEREEDREEDREERDRPRKRRKGRRERESSSPLMWIVGILAGVVSFVGAFVLVYFLTRGGGNNPPQVAVAPNAPGQQAANPAPANPGAGNPRANANQQVKPPVNPAPVAPNNPGVDAAPPGFYADAAGEEIQPADPGLPNTVLRPRADETLFRLSNARVGQPSGRRFGPPSFGPALMVDYEVTRRGKNTGNTIVLHSGDGGRQSVHLSGMGQQERGTIELSTFPSPFSSGLPKNVELYMVRTDARWGKDAPTFKISNSAVMGAMPVTTKARNWTREEFDRYTKEPPPPPKLPNYAAPNLHQAVGEDTAFVGDVKGGGKFRYVEPNGYLYGLEYRLATWDNEKCIGGLTPIFTRDQPTTLPDRVMAKEGYAVAGIEVHTIRFVDGIRLLYQRVKKDGTLDPADAYSSDLIGYAAPGQPQKLAMEGRRAIGINCQQGAILNALALVMNK